VLRLVISMHLEFNMFPAVKRRVVDEVSLTLSVDITGVFV
jgi:hypothetical protein